MRKLLLALPLLAAVPLMAQSAPQLPGTTDVSRVTAGTYKTDPGHTLIGWRVSHFGFNDYFGIFGDATGTLTLDPKNPNAATVDITIPVSKVTTASAGLTGHLLRAGKDGGKPDFFGPAPADAKFVSTKVEANGTTAKITGNLTLNGVTKPVVLDTKFSGAGNNPFNKKATVGFHATTTIKRSDFGVSYAVPMISDDVALDISVAFEKAS
ncbi:YceI family protein [Sphingorhabdus contaminans]|jgi:polyisoprenoid-binding protein YceI|uniref:Polyisoprenoid-binding protein n=1 Tax=Sphingorhabdus contaminans TaxID=1343899 RepID=A0A553WJC0_9SPHN|nr:YceI family protein [Sphingorhabdus contaminans]TSB04776.1 polyisoprenoid-binding protein [Sphingorhabdus contaminans]